MIKSCKTCANRYNGTEFGKCSISDHYCSTERKFGSTCGEHFKHWVERTSTGLKFQQAWYRFLDWALRAPKSTPITPTTVPTAEPTLDNFDNERNITLK
jgi:hypothetical protein